MQRFVSLSYSNECNYTFLFLSCISSYCIIAQNAIVFRDIYLHCQFFNARNNNCIDKAFGISTALFNKLATDNQTV